MPSTPEIETTQIEAPAEDDDSEPFSATIRVTFTQREARMIPERAGVSRA